MKRAPTDKLYSLTDFDVREVHLVDLAANKQRFLIAKRRDPMPNEPQNDDNVSDIAPDDAPRSQSITEQGSASTDTSAQILDALCALQETVATLKASQAAAEAEPKVAETSKGENVEVIKNLTQRLVRLEKQFAVPNSERPERAPARHDAHAWPFDINRPLFDDEIGSPANPRGAGA